MAQDNLEKMRAAISAFNQRDANAFQALLADDVEIVPIRAALERTTFRGPDAARRYCAAVDESWDGLRWELEELRAGDDQVLGLGRIRGRGRGSSVDIDVHGGWLATFSEGVIVRFQTFPERSRALDAAGLA